MYKLKVGVDYNENPGQRFKFATATDGKIIYLFGGYRIWEGYAADNSWENSWSSFKIVSDHFFIFNYLLNIRFAIVS
jgi:hypothetical protein